MGRVHRWSKTSLTHQLWFSRPEHPAMLAGSLMVLPYIFSTNLIFYISHRPLFDTILILPYVRTCPHIIYINLCAIDLRALSICISCFVYIGIASEALIVLPFLPSFFTYEVIRELLFYMYKLSFWHCVLVVSWPMHTK